jgi:hypothetical protein
MVKARGPVWHRKQQKLNIVPKGLHGLDKQAKWGVSKAKGWIYGHGTFSLTAMEIPILGMFQWMPNSGNEARKMEKEIIEYSGTVKKVFMDSKADNQKIYFNLKQNYRIQLVTVPRKGMDKSESRKQMIKEMLTKQNIKDYRKRSVTVEPMQGLVDNIFELDKCWMRGNDSNRWLFAAMGIAIQMAQSKAFREQRSIWNIKNDVLGV